MISLVIPAYNEALYIGPCLASIAAQESLPQGHGLQVIVAANGCHDATVSEAESHRAALEAAGFSLTVLDLPEPGKTGALNAADATAQHPSRLYLDADIRMDPPLLAQMIAALDRPDPVYVGANVRIPPAKSWVSRAYARVWTDLPFFRDGVPAIGLFGVNGPGRARWGEWPKIIGDDRFSRLQFRAEERIRLEAGYDWPLPEGAANLIRTRRRWCEGNDEVEDLFPDLMTHDSQRNRTASGVLNLLKTPLSSVVYVAITVISRRLSLWYPSRTGWRRGR